MVHVGFLFVLFFFEAGNIIPAHTTFGILCSFGFGIFWFVWWFLVGWVLLLSLLVIIIIIIAIILSRPHNFMEKREDSPLSPSQLHHL